MPSNNLIVNGARLPLPQSVLAAGGTAVNFLDDGEPHLRGAKRTKPLVTYVLHETAGNTAGGCKATLKANGLGVHLILDKDGVISNHADLATEICWHASQVNPVSVGMEVVNAYRPENSHAPQGHIIPAEWWTWVPKGADRTYMTPTDVQMHVARALVPWLCDHLGIPLTFPTGWLNAKKPQIAGWRSPPLGWSAKPGPGIVSHRSFSSHSDGEYMLRDLMATTGDGL